MAVICTLDLDGWPEYAPSSLHLTEGSGLRELPSTLARVSAAEKNNADTGRWRHHSLALKTSMGAAACFSDVAVTDCSAAYGTQGS